jgi:hypothetical protein
MGEHRHTARFANPSYGFHRPRQFALDEGRPAVGQVPVKGFLCRRDEFFLHQHTGDVGTSDGFRTGQRADLLIGDGDAQLIQALDNLGVSGVAAIPQAHQALRQQRIGPVQKITEDMKFTLPLS